MVNWKHHPVLNKALFLASVVIGVCLLITIEVSPVLAGDLGAKVSPGDLIVAVNQLRIEHGLNTLTVHPILMQTAQMQAEALLASDGAVGHTRPNGLSYTDQLITLGYPLAGDLSLGGFRAENILSAHPDMGVGDVIQMWLSDTPHTNTMLSPYYTDIGAGIAIATDGTVYFVLDCAMQTSSGLPQAYTPVSGPAGGDGQDVAIQYIQPVILATARPDGDVVHEVLYGHALWSIAIAYGVKIEQIQRYNNIGDTTIYTGQTLLVQKGATQPVPTQQETSTPAPLASRTPRPTASLTASPTTEPEAGDQTAGSENTPDAVGPSLVVIIVGIAIVSMLVGGLITWFGDRKGE